MVLVDRNSLQAEGSVSSRSVWPVGAVSNTTWSKSPATPVPARSAAKASKAAISTVQPPENCSSMLRIAASGSRLR